MFDGSHDRQLAARQPRLAPSVYALVGLDLHDALVALAYPNWKGLDVRDVEGLGKLFEEYGADIKLIIHTAAQPWP